MNLTHPEIEQYCIEMSTPPDPLCEELSEFTKHNHEMPQMLIGPLEASFLGQMIRLSGARRVLEVGTYTGYSALAMAGHLPPQGELHTLDINPETNRTARGFWERSVHGKKIIPHLGNAAEVIPQLEGQFDLAFIDADKENYKTYLDQILKKLSPGGIIIVDNVLWSGRAVEGSSFDDGKISASTRGIREFNQYVSARDDLFATMVPLRDGLFLIQKVRGKGE